MIIKRTIKQKWTNEDFGLTFTDNFLTNPENNISWCELWCETNRKHIFLGQDLSPKKIEKTIKKFILTQIKTKIKKRARDLDVKLKIRTLKNGLKVGADTFDLTKYNNDYAWLLTMIFEHCFHKYNH